MAQYCLFKLAKLQRSFEAKLLECIRKVPRISTRSMTVAVKESIFFLKSIGKYGFQYYSIKLLLYFRR